nr:2860_t:CDS:2 [Entrophospora candida]CAG8589642.1 16046_t:CDS:2 [Entrophospora candida]
MSTVKESNTTVSSDSESNETGKKKHNLKPLDLQRLQVERLLQRIDKPVTIPEIQDKPKLKPPKDIVRNVQGSSAGAGSGEFHVYRAHRRREYTRIKLMEEETAKEEEKREFEEKIASIKEQEELKTAKKRKESGSESGSEK